jgi:hypothetical protein
MRRLPRVNEEIFDTGEIFTPEKLPEALDAAWQEIEANANSGTGSGTGSASFLRSGRYISAPVEPEGGDAFLPPSPALAILLPEGFEWVQDGRGIVLEDDVIVNGIPANFEGWVRPVYDFEENSWSLLTYAPNARPAKGAGVLGYALADADEVLTIDVSEAKSDVIFTMPYLVSQMLAANAAIAGLLQSGGSSGGGAFYWETAAKSPTDDTTIEEAFTAADNALKAELSRQIAGKDSRAMRSDVDELRVEHGITNQTTIKLSPLDGMRSRSANVLRVVGGMYGTGENGYPDNIGPTTVPLHSEDGTFGP